MNEHYPQHDNVCSSGSPYYVQAIRMFQENSSEVTSYVRD